MVNIVKIVSAKPIETLRRVRVELFDSDGDTGNEAGLLNQMVKW